jgi:hypothetical protein
LSEGWAAGSSTLSNYKIRLTSSTEAFASLYLMSVL